MDRSRLAGENQRMPRRAPLLASAAVALLLGVGGCAATWEGMKRDSEGIFGGESETEVVAEAQRLLNERGYDAGPADGLEGPRTIRAVRAYQADHGLDRTGRVDDELLDSLRGDAPRERARAESPPKDEDWVDPY